VVLDLSEFNADTVGIMIKDMVLACVFFIIFIYCFIDLYQVIVQQSAITTGNPTADMLISMIGLVFSAAVMMIMYKNYVSNEGG
jgi:hypothetical protein